MKKLIMALAVACFCLVGAVSAEAHDNSRKHSSHNDRHPPRVAVKKYKYVPVVRYYKPVPYAYGHNRHHHPQYVRYTPRSYSYWSYWR